MAVSADRFWWPSDLGIFDFSLRFEEATFEILPCSLFLLFGIAVFVYYHRQPVYVRTGALLWLKLVCACFRPGRCGS